MKPKTVMVRVRDLKPYHYGIWCSIENGAPFVNEIVHMVWRDDGTITLMLESFNFMTGLTPQAELEVVELEPSEYAKSQYANWRIQPPATQSREVL